MAAKALGLFLLAVLLLAPLVFAEDLNIENKPVGEELSGRKLMRDLLWNEPPQPPPKKGWPWPKEQKKTCYVTIDKVKTFDKDEYVTSTCDQTYLKKVTFEKKKTYPVTSYVTSTFEKVKKIPKVKEDITTSTYVSTCVETYMKTFEYIYEKKGWNDDYWVPPQCKKPPPPHSW